jgi:hypothetical protein
MEKSRFRTLVSLIALLTLANCQSNETEEPSVDWENYDKSVKLKIDSLIFNKNCDALKSELFSESYSDIRTEVVGKRNLDFLNYLYFEMNVINCDLEKSDNAITWRAWKRDSVKLANKNMTNQTIEQDFLKTKAGKIYKKHPNWSKNDCEKIANNEIWIGMEYEMLVYLRGRPNHVNTSNYGKGEEYQACWDNYDPGCFYFDETQIIKSYN